MATNSHSRISIAKLIFIPSLITLAVTVLRVVGEFQHWPTALFNPSAGGGGSIIGITWLALVFGAYFGVKLARASDEQPTAGRVIGYAFLGLVLFAAGMFLGFGLKAEFPGKIVVGLLLIVVSIFIPFLGWNELAKTLLAYAYAARIPVLILMYFAMRGNWGTHYDAVPPGFPENMSFWMKYVQLAVVPQLIMWISFTTVMGSIFGGVALALTRRGKQHAPQPA